MKPSKAHEVEIHCYDHGSYKATPSGQECPRCADPVQRYLRELADALHLKDWRVVLMPGEARPGAIAEVVVTWGQRHAEVRLCEDFPRRPEPVRRNALVHELIHLHMDAVHRAIDHVEGELSQGAWRVLERTHRLAIEHATDAMAGMLANVMRRCP